MMGINSLFIFIGIVMVFTCIPFSQSVDTHIHIRECNSNKNCYVSERCDGMKCIDACINISCGENAFCYTRDHVADCSCMEGFFGNPATKCVGEEPDDSFGRPKST